jgi:hypothetical protein
MALTRIRIANNPADIRAVPEIVVLEMAVIRMGCG